MPSKRAAITATYAGASLPSARQRPCLRTCLHGSGEGDVFSPIGLRPCVGEDDLRRIRAAADRKVSPALLGVHFYV